MKHWMITYSCRNKSQGFLMYETTAETKSPFELLMYLNELTDQYYTDYSIVFAMEISEKEYKEYKEKY